ncbi:hypothetical protein [Crocosphaera sp. Alani8]|uniref:hypothetical protein n=1 Tax=Crocosphaera sp. Alani8 TaxID=3038952 RepID=UPI00313BB67F
MFSNVRVIASPDKEGKRLPLLLYGNDVAIQWHENPEKIVIYQQKTLKSLSSDDLEDLKRNKEVIFVEKDDLLLDELYFIDLNNALPGGLMPKYQNNNGILFNDRRVTPLIPLNPILLDYFTPEDLVNKISFKIEENQVCLTLNLPLSGMQKENKNIQDNSQSSQNYLLQKYYELKEDNLIPDQLPVLEV